MADRSRTLTVMLDDDEIARLHALADEGKEPIAPMLRRWIRDRYRARFGTATPPAPKLRPGPGRKRTVAA